MSNESNVRYGRHCIFKLHRHLVFVARYRRRVFNAQTVDVLRGIFADVCPDTHDIHDSVVVGAILP
jgi:putative transposase